MKLKVHVQKIWPSPENDKMLGPSMAEVYAPQMAMMQDVFGPNVDMKFGYNEASSYYTNCASLEAYNNVGMLNAMMQAEADGVDVVLIGCGNDPALEAARDLLSIPVVSITESAMLLACQLGRRFGLITFDDQSVPLVERNLRLYGLEDRAVRNRPVRSSGFYESTTAWFSDRSRVYDYVVPRFEEVAKGLMEDGAEVIITACGNFAAFTVHGYSKITGTTVPVIDAVAAGAHMAKLAGEMYRKHGITTSKQGAYRGAGAEIVRRFTAPFQGPRTAETLNGSVTGEAAE